MPKIIKRHELAIVFLIMVAVVVGAAWGTNQLREQGVGGPASTANSAR